MQVPDELNIPADVSSSLKEFLSGRMALAKARAQIHNQRLNALPMEVSREQIAQMQEEGQEIFEQQQGRNLDDQARRAENLPEEADEKALPVLGPPNIPADASLELKVFLNQRSQLMREQVQLFNQNSRTNSVSRSLVVEQWMKENAVRLEGLQALAEELSSTPITARPYGAAQTK